jgi:hypothetical protein
VKTHPFRIENSVSSQTDSRLKLPLHELLWIESCGSKSENLAFAGSEKTWTHSSQITSNSCTLAFFKKWSLKSSNLVPLSVHMHRGYQILVKKRSGLDPCPTGSESEWAGMSTWIFLGGIDDFGWMDVCHRINVMSDLWKSFNLYPLCGRPREWGPDPIIHGPAAVYLWQIFLLKTRLLLVLDPPMGFWGKWSSNSNFPAKINFRDSFSRKLDFYWFLTH